jgi:hypothetical protein
LTEITIPNSVKKIGKYAFEGSGFKSFTVSDGITSIDDGAFVGCTHLEKFVIGENVTSLGTDVFGDCSGLKEFAVSEKNTKYSTIEGILVTKDQTILLQYPNAKSSDFSIPNVYIKIIGERAFAGCGNINKITIPANVTTISREAFARCGNLSTVTFGSGIDSIGPKAFQGCSKLDDFELPENLAYISDSTFFNCAALNGIMIPDKVITIGAGAFAHCERMKNLTIGKEVTAIGEAAFTYCPLTMVIIPDNVVKIGRNAFRDCHNVSGLVIGKKVKEIAPGAFYSMGDLNYVYNRNPVPQNVTSYPADVPIFYTGPHVPLPTLYVPANTITAYKNADYWKNFYIEEKEYIVANETIHEEYVTVFNTIGGIVINSAEPVFVAIYTVSGQIVYHERLNGRKDISLPRGIYFVKTGALTKKIYVE